MTESTHSTEQQPAVKAAGFKSVEVLTINGFETQEL